MIENKGLEGALGEEKARSMFRSSAKLRMALSGRNKRAKWIESELEKLRKASTSGVHLGSGTKRIDGLLNCDKFAAESDMICDMTDLSAFQDHSIDLIESHHAIEHLSFKDANIALSEWHRVLIPGGVLILSCPDFGAICRLWMRSTIVNKFADRKEARSYILKMVCGSQENEGMFHRSQYDQVLMNHLLQQNRFQVIGNVSGFPCKPTPSFLTIAVANHE